MRSVPEDVSGFLRDMGSVDIVVGIPSFNNKETIGFVAEVAARGIKSIGLSGLIVNADGKSSDGTTTVFMKSNTEGIPKTSYNYIGPSGKGTAMKSVMEVSQMLNAKVVVFLDSDLRSVKPWWIERLAIPILEEKASYVTPLYLRHKYDGTITNTICYPLTSALYGIKIRQPIGGDFGLSAEIIQKILEKPANIWKSNVTKFGIDIFMTTTALNEAERGVFQAALGAKVHDVKDPAKHLEGMFTQVVDTLFRLMITYEERWKQAFDITEAQIYGESPQENIAEMAIDETLLRKKAEHMVFEAADRLQKYLPSELIEKVLQQGVINCEEWASIVFNSALVFKREPSEQIVKNLIGFYFARVAGFVEETSGFSSEEAERVVDQQVDTFLSMKRQFVERW